MIGKKGKEKKNQKMESKKADLGSEGFLSPLSTQIPLVPPFSC